MKVHMLVNTKESIVVKIDLVMTTDTTEPDTEIEISAKMKKMESIIGIIKNSSSDFSFSIFIYVKKSNIRMVGSMVTMSIPKPDMKKVISAKIEKDKIYHDNY